MKRKITVSTVSSQVDNHRQGSHLQSLKHAQHSPLACVLHPMNNYQSPTRPPLPWPLPYRRRQSPHRLTSKLEQQKLSPETYLQPAPQIGFLLLVPSNPPQGLHRTTWLPDFKKYYEWLVSGWMNEETARLVIILKQYVYFLRIIWLSG